jgi:transposase
MRPHRVSGDKAYGSGQIRRYLHRRGIRTTIPRKKNEHRGGPFDREIYRSRNRIERLINRLKQYRRGDALREAGRELPSDANYSGDHAVVIEFADPSDA